MDDPIISKEQYFFWLDSGVPYEGWVDYGDGNLAWALNTVEVVGIPYNKYKDKYFAPVNVSVCVMDKTKVNNSYLDAKKQTVDSKIAMEQKKKEVKSKLIKAVSDYYDTKIYSAKLNVKQIEGYNTSKMWLNHLISDDTKPVSFSDFPQDMFFQNAGLISDFIQIRNVSISSPQKQSTEKTNQISKNISKKNECINKAVDALELSISDKGLEFLMNREGVILTPYNDSKGYATIGVGHLIAKRGYTAQDEIDWAWLDTRQEAMDLFKKDLSTTYEPAVRRLVTVTLSQEQYDAIVSFTYNVGVGGLQKSNFLKELNKGNYDGNLMLRYKRPSEVIRRRQKEVDLFNKGIYK